MCVNCFLIAAFSFSDFSRSPIMGHRETGHSSMVLNMDLHGDYFFILFTIVLINSKK